MLNICKVAVLPQALTPDTIYLTKDASNNLVITVTDALGTVTVSTNSTETIADLIKDYTDGEIAKVIAMMSASWETLTVDHPGTWAADIYILQRSGNDWRVKKITSAGSTLYSFSTDTANASYTIDTAWADRTNLTYH